MKIYRNGYVPAYERYFFFLHGKCIELHNIFGDKFHISFSPYRRSDVIKEPENFPVVGEISEKEIVEFILGKVVKKMTDRERREIKNALLQCAKENESRNYATFHIVVSSICRSAKERIEELEKQVEKMKNCVNCGSYIDYVRPDSPDYKCRECEDGSEWRLKDD